DDFEPTLLFCGGSCRVRPWRFLHFLANPPRERRSSVRSAQGGSTTLIGSKGQEAWGKKRPRSCLPRRCSAPCLRGKDVNHVQPVGAPALSHRAARMSPGTQTSSLSAEVFIHRLSLAARLKPLASASNRSGAYCCLDSAFLPTKVRPLW